VKVTRLAVFCFASLALVGCVGGGGGGTKKLDAGGSSFVGPLMEEWAKVYQKEKGVEVNYARTGSGDGINKMTDKLYAFGCSDAPMNADQLKNAQGQGGAVVHVPVVLGALVPVYNLPQIKDRLHFSGPVLADIYLGNVKKWNDQPLKDLNPGVELPDLPIWPVHRSEASGSSFIWSSYLTQVSPEWKDKVGAKMDLSKLPTGEGAKGTDGVTTQVISKEGALGYVELLYALKNKDKMNFGTVRNKAGKDVLAGPESVAAAGEQALQDVPDDLIVSLVNADGDASYPVCGVVYAVLYANQPADRGPATLDFLKWVVHDGQQYAPKLDYARLPDKLVKGIDAKLASVKVGS
jgi:phosphate ABC transporter phosphate-binding protein